MTTILIKKKDTAGAPSAGDLTNSSGGAEIAVNTATKRIYTKDSGGNIVETGTNPSSISTGAVTATSVTDSGLTSGRVPYASTGGLLADSANLTFNGTTLTANTLNLTNQLGTTYGGTGLTSFTSGGAVYASSTSALTTGTLPVASGGTGATTLTANNVLLGNGTSAPQTVAPGTSGNVLTSNGSTWESQPATSSGITTGKSIAMAMIFGF